MNVVDIDVFLNVFKFDLVRNFVICVWSICYLKVFVFYEMLMDDKERESVKKKWYNCYC